MPFSIDQEKVDQCRLAWLDGDLGQFTIVGDGIDQ
jgi:hypothetical protein